MLNPHKGSCEENFEKNYKLWKKCPKCSMFIEKTEDSNNMVC